MSRGSGGLSGGRSAKGSAGGAGGAVSPAENNSSRLRDAAKAALTGSHIAPFAPEPPFRLEVDFLTSAMAEAASVVPGAERSAARTVAITASDSDSLARYRGVLLTMAATALGI